MRIEKFLSTTCLGYSNNLSETYFQQEILFEDGSTKIMYGTNIELKNGSISMLPLTEKRPYVARPIKETE